MTSTEARPVMPAAALPRVAIAGAAVCAWACLIAALLLIGGQRVGLDRLPDGPRSVPAIRMPGREVPVQRGVHAGRLWTPVLKSFGEETSQIA